MHRKSEVTLKGIRITVVLDEDGIGYRNIPAGFLIDLFEQCFDLIIVIIAVLRIRTHSVIHRLNSVECPEKDGHLGLITIQITLIAAVRAPTVKDSGTFRQILASLYTHSRFQQFISDVFVSFTSYLSNNSQGSTIIFYILSKLSYVGYLAFDFQTEYLGDYILKSKAHSYIFDIVGTFINSV